MNRTSESGTAGYFEEHDLVAIFQAAHYPFSGYDKGQMKSTREPSPINIPDGLASCRTGPDQFERLELFRAVIAVPHEEIAEEEKTWKGIRASLKRSSE